MSIFCKIVLWQLPQLKMMRDWITSEKLKPLSTQVLPFSKKILKLQNAVEKVIRESPKRLSFRSCALLARGHLLIEDVPEWGKRLLLRLWRGADCSFQRIQFTSGMLPTDIDRA